MPNRVALLLSIFLVVYTFLFWLIGSVPVFHFLSERDILVVVGLYSMAGFIFSVLSGFVVQSKWNVWDRLVEASHGEINALKQLHLLARHLPLRLHGLIREEMKGYLQALVHSGWQHGHGPSAEMTHKALMRLEDAIYTLEDQNKNSRTAQIAYDLLAKIMHWKEQRENYSRRTTPIILRMFLFFAVIMIVFMSLVLPISSWWLKYVLTLGVALLAYAPYVMIDDLDHPYRPGSWHLSGKEYSNLLSEVECYD